MHTDWSSLHIVTLYCCMCCFSCAADQILDVSVLRDMTAIKHLWCGISFTLNQRLTHALTLNQNTCMLPSKFCCSFRKRLSSFIMFVCLNDEQIVLLLLAMIYKAVEENEGCVSSFSQCLSVSTFIAYVICVCNRFLDALVCLEYKWLQ